MPNAPLGMFSSAFTYPIVTGGQEVLEDSTYIYRVFTANSNLVISNKPVEFSYCIAGGGGGSGVQSQEYAIDGQVMGGTYWQGYYNYHNCFAGPGGGGGSAVHTGTVTWAPQTVSVTIGAGGNGGGVFGNNGSACSISATPSISSTYYGYGSKGPIGGVNSLYNPGAWFTTSSSGESNPGNGSLDPYYHTGGGGAGANGNGSGANGGPSKTVFESVGQRSLGGGGAGKGGSYEANDYHRNFFYYIQPLPFTSTAYGTSGTGGGNEVSKNGTVNTGSGAAGAFSIGGTGGSGVFIVRYLRSAVGA